MEILKFSDLPPINARWISTYNICDSRLLGNFTDKCCWTNTCVQKYGYKFQYLPCERCEKF